MTESRHGITRPYRHATRISEVATGEDDHRLYRVIFWGYVSLFPFTALFVVTAVPSHSATLVVYAVLSAIALSVQTFTVYALRQVLRQNEYEFPYGAGKLEDFSAFVCHLLYIPTGLFMAYDAITRIVEPHAVRYAISLIPVLLSACRTTVLYYLSRRLVRSTHLASPILKALGGDYETGALGDIGVIIAFVIGFQLVNSGMTAAGNRVDPVIGLVISLYIVWGGASMLRRNFRSLMDLPLPEDEQIRVMKVLAGHYADYETIGTIYTRASGKLRFVEIEMVFARGRTIEEIDAVSEAMEADLAAELPGLSFRIIAVGALQ